MNNPKFCPCPWFIHHGTMPGLCYIDSSENEILLGDICVIYNATSDCRQANANLIAAAPEMYSFLEEILLRELIAPEKEQTIADIEELLKKARGEA